MDSIILTLDRLVLTPAMSFESEGSWLAPLESKSKAGKCNSDREHG